MKILAINGSYRANGFTDQLLYNLTRTLEEKGADIEQIDLRDYPIGFCLNCRECCQKPGSAAGKCIQTDGMAALVKKIEAADAFILASPTNFGSVTALFKRFMERLLVFAYWPWGKVAPAYRKKGLKAKPALLVTSSAAPAFMARWAFSSFGQLKDTSKIMGATVCGVLSSGLVAGTPYPTINARINQQIKKVAEDLVLLGDNYCRYIQKNGGQTAA